MLCTKCGKEIEGNALFCTNCGTTRGEIMQGYIADGEDIKKIILPNTKAFNGYYDDKPEETVEKIDKDNKIPEVDEVEEDDGELKFPNISFIIAIYLMKNYWGDFFYGFTFTSENIVYALKSSGFWHGVFYTIVIATVISFVATWAIKKVSKFLDG